MGDSTNTLALAVLSALAAQAKKKGKKSFVKAVVRRLRDGGASEQLIGLVSAVGATKPAKDGKAKDAKPPKAIKVKKGSKKGSKDAAKIEASAKTKAPAKAEPSLNA
jgi:hypothetical protein